MNALFSNILLAFDGSDGSYDALKRAEGLSKQNNAHVTVAYVIGQHSMDAISQGEPLNSLPDNPTFYQTPTSAGAIPIPNITSKFKQKNSDEQIPDTILSDAKIKLSNALQKVDYELLEGDPAHEICEYAKQKDIDLIVIGNRGLSGFKKFVMGSVSEHVTKKAHCPVLVCK